MKHAIRVAAFAAAALCTSVLISQVEQKTQRFPQFENPDVKVWKTVVMPNQPLAMHTTIIPESSSPSPAAP